MEEVSSRICFKEVKLTDLSLQVLAHIVSYIDDLRSPPCTVPTVPASPPTSSLPVQLLWFAQASPLFEEAVAIALRRHAEHLTPRGERAAFSKWLQLLAQHVHTLSHFGNDREALLTLCSVKPPILKLRALDLTDARDVESHLITSVLNTHGRTLEALALSLSACTSVEDMQSTMPALNKVHVQLRRERRARHPSSSVLSALLTAILDRVSHNSVTHLSFSGFHEGAVADVAFCDDLTPLFSSVVQLTIDMWVAAAHRSYHATAHFIGLFRFLRKLSFTGHEFCARDTIKIINSCSKLSDMRFTANPPRFSSSSERDAEYNAHDMFREFGASLKCVHLMSISVAPFLRSLQGTASNLRELRITHLWSEMDLLISIVEQSSELRILHIRMGAGLRYESTMLGPDRWLRFGDALERRSVTLHQLSVVQGRTAFHDSHQTKMSAEEEAALLSCFQRAIRSNGPTLTLIDFQVSVGRGSFVRCAEATVTLLKTVSESCTELRELVLRLNDGQNYFGSHLQSRKEFARFLLVSLQSNTKRLLSKSPHLWRLDLQYLSEAARDMMGDEEPSFNIQF